jgi:hypothetical protein
MSKRMTDDYRVEIIWQWLQDVKAPVAIKIAFKALAMKYVLDNNLKYWQEEEEDATD